MKQIFNGLVTNNKFGEKGSFLHRLVKLVPPGILAIIVKWHYYNVVRSFSDEQIDDLKFCRYLVKKNDHVFDVGANIGVYTKILSNWVGAQGSVYSIEPIPSTYKILSYNINKLNLINVNSLNCAISDTSGAVTMRIPKNNLGIGNHYLAHVIESPIHSSSEVYLIKSCTLDDLLSDTYDRISLIKIDTEGHELACVKGAQEMIYRWKPAFLIEVSSDLSQKASEGYQLNEILRKYGYQPFQFDGISVSRWQPGESSINYFFLRPEHINTLKQQNLYRISNN